MQLQRLVDLPDPVAPELAAARDLVRATRPLAPSLDRMQRVRQALRAKAPPPAMAGSSVIVKATLLLLAAGVTAGLLFWGPRSLPPRSQSPARQPQLAPADPAAAAGSPELPAHPTAAPLTTAPDGALTHIRGKIHRRPSAAAGPGAVPAAPPLLPTSAAPLPTAAPSIVDAPEDAAPAPAVESSDEVDPAEASFVLSATQALRQRREPARARALLVEYHSRFPQGALQEEALALDLESLVALADPQAGPRAREYLRRYPGGRFRTFAAAAAARYPAPQSQTE